MSGARRFTQMTRRRASMPFVSQSLAIQAIGLSKRYGERVALADVHLKVKPGQLHGLLGANGAGAIPLLRILLGLAARDSGTARLLGRELRSTREPMERKPGLPASPRRSSRSPAAAAVRLLPPASNRRSARPSRIWLIFR